MLRPGRAQGRGRGRALSRNGNSMREHRDVPGMTSQSFPPVASPNARLLILGSFPGERSLRDQRYYAHPRNAFWPIMEALFADGASLDYAARCRLLTDARIALWDVLLTTQRQGSLDSAIVPESAVPNAIGDFLSAHPGIHTICFNGSTAATLFQRHIAPGLARLPNLRLLRLPSTSPAYAGMSFEGKLAAWRVVAEYV